MLDSILDRPLSQVIVIWIGSLALVFGGFWYYGYQGLQEQVVELEDKEEDLKVQILEQQRIARSLPKLKKEVKELDIGLEKALLELPNKSEIPNLLSSISDLALESGLQVSTFSPKTGQKRDFYAEIPVEMSVEGSFHQMATFFDEVGHLERIVNIDTIVMDVDTAEKAEKKIMIRGSCRATTFRYLDESERIKSDGGKKKGKKRRRR